jgi:hypothetical protein
MGRRSRARSMSARRDFNIAVEAVACNFLIMHLLTEKTTLAVPRAHKLMWSGGRYRSSVYGQHFLDVIDILCALELVTRLSTGFRVSSTIKGETLIVPAEQLNDLLPLAGFGPDALIREEEAEVLVLKERKDADGVAALVDYKDTTTTRRLRAQVRRLNRWFRAADIKLADQGPQLRLGGDGEVVAPFRLSARRIFNNDNWQHGGRLAGPFFMSMEKAARFRMLRIDSERIADVDYRQLFPRLAYARAQCAQPVGDLYDISQDGSCRKGWKTLLSALLFARGRLGNWPDDTRQHFPEGTKLKDAIARICQRHEKIAHLFGTALGYSLMKIESDMIIAVTTYLFQSGITACPIHDGIVCARSRADLVREAMQHQFEKITGSSRAIVNIDFGPL